MDEVKFSLVADSVRLVCPCVCLTLYLDLTNEPAVLSFYERVMEALKGELKFVIAESDTRRKKIDDRALSMVPTWLKKPRPYKSYYIAFHENQEGCGPAKFEMSYSSFPEKDYPPEKLEARRNNWRTLEQQNPGGLGLSNSQLIVTFPLTHPLAQPSALLHWIKELALVARGPLVSGYCGLGLNDYRETGNGELSFQLQQKMASLVLQHPGLDWQNPLKRRLIVFKRDADDLIPLIKRVNWLTFVGKRAVEYLGGRDSLNKHFAENREIGVHEFPWGVMVQAGSSPQLGDIGHRDFIPNYRDVAKVLRPIRLPRIDGIGRGFTDEAANEWLNAFDRDY